ncbi:hypothetical protein HYW32_00265 [Candidatus Berkelbacteria bacterium]|nr:hypothetical protein [Candidatus Berkelbacteria bacterium]
MNCQKITKWLLDCQLTDGHYAGGLLEGEDVRTGNYEFVYFETTGYLLTYLVNEYQATREEIFLHRAKQAVQFLTANLTRWGLPYTLDPKSSKLDRRVFTFDNAIIISGLLDLFTVTKLTRYRALALLISRPLIKSMIRTDGTVRAYRDLQTGRVTHSGTDFATDESCIHIKDSIALLKLARATGRGKYRTLAERLLATAPSFQRPDGSFLVHKNGSFVFSHAHCYATEGCLYGYLSTGSKEYLKWACAAGDYLSSAQAWTGGIYQYERSGQTAADATSQAIRIWRSLDLITGRPAYGANIKRALAYLDRMQAAQGGLRYTQGRFLGRSPILYTWVSMFARSAQCLTGSPAPLINEIY